MSREEIHAEVNFGAEICTKIKSCYFAEQKWNGKLCMKIANIFTALKKLIKPLFPDDAHLEMLRKVSHYSCEDFIELVNISGLNIEQEVLRETPRGHLANILRAN